MTQENHECLSFLWSVDSRTNPSLCFAGRNISLILQMISPDRLWSSLLDNAEEGREKGKLESK